MKLCRLKLPSRHDALIGALALPALAGAQAQTAARDGKPPAEHWIVAGALR